MRVARVFVCGVLGAVCAVSTHAFAQSKLAEINQKTITVLSGESQWFDQTLAITQKMSHVDGLRLIAMHGDGCIDSAADVLQLTQVDVALLSSDCVDYAQAQGLLPSSAKEYRFLARIKAKPLLLLTTRDFKNVTALAGKRIATGAANSAGFASGELLLGGLDLPFTRVARNGADAVEALKRGEADAVLLHGADDLSAIDSKGFHVLGLTAPQGLSNQYAPALVDAGALGGSVETVSTSLLLAVYNWPKNSAKAQKIRQFTKVYFEQQHAAGDDAQELSAAVPGWQRHDVSQQALNALSLTTPELQQGDGP